MAGQTWVPWNHDHGKRRSGANAEDLGSPVAAKRDRARDNAPICGRIPPRRVPAAVLVCGAPRAFAVPCRPNQREGAAEDDEREERGVDDKGAHTQRNSDGHIHQRPEHAGLELGLPHKDVHDSHLARSIHGSLRVWGYQKVFEESGEDAGKCEAQMPQLRPPPTP